MDEQIERYVKMAKQGSKNDLDKLINRIKSRIYHLSLRMLAFPEDAEDATQEILIKVITHLNDFKEESRFTTWLYRIAVNHLLTIKKYRAKNLDVNFNFWEEEIARQDTSFNYDSIPDQAKVLLTEEVRILCMQTVLQCLKSKIRITFILGEVFEMSGEDAADILGISKVAYRKRLSRARFDIIEAMQKNCNLVNSENPCHCYKLVGPDIRDKWIDPDNLQFVGTRCHAKINQTIKNQLIELDEIGRVIALFRSYPDYSTPDSITKIVKELIGSNRYTILHH